MQFTRKFTHGCWLRVFRSFKRNLAKQTPSPLVFFCLTVAPFTPNEPAPEVPDLLRRIDALLAAGGNVLLFSPTRALPHDGSRKPPYEGACAFRCGPFPDDSSVLRRLRESGRQTPGGPRASVR